MVIQTNQKILWSYFSIFYQYNNKQEKHKEVVDWSEDGSGIHIKNVYLFEQVAKSNFALNQLSSFIRQLHFYDFKKVKTPTKDMIYTHPYFKKGMREDLEKIRRKKRIRKKKNTKVKLSKEIKEETADLKVKLLALEERIKETEEHMDSVEKANETLQQSKKDFQKEWRRRVDIVTKTFAFMIHYFSEELVNRVCSYFIRSGFSPGIEDSGNYKIVQTCNFQLILFYLQIRVRNLMFYTREEDNFLDGFYQSAIGKNPDWAEQKPFLFFYNSVKHRIYEEIFGLELSTDNDINPLDVQGYMKQQTCPSNVNLENCSEIKEYTSKKDEDNRSIILKGNYPLDNHSLRSFEEIKDKFNFR